MGDGTCWAVLGKEGRLARWDEDAGEFVEQADLGLSGSQTVHALAVGPDGTGWTTVRTDLGLGGPLEGLMRYDLGTWTFVPYTGGDGSEPEDDGVNRELAVGPDGRVWIVGLGDTGFWVRSWDGQTWDRFGPLEDPFGPPSTALPMHSYAGAGRPLTHFRADGSIAFVESNLLFDGKSLHLLDLPEGWLLIPPDVYVWSMTSDTATKDVHFDGNQVLYVIDPQALAAAE
jgi:hypothetical protein